MDAKVKQWIEEGRDPRSANWQAGLESLMDVFGPYLEPGKLTPIQLLAEDHASVFQEVLEVIDLSPNLQAAFLPPPVANRINPPESAEELQRIETNKPSFKILIARHEGELRILCAEISPQATKPGVDIFQSGALLGTYDYTDRDICLSNLNKILRAHIWQKEKWRPADYKRYTLHWFERIIDLQKGTVPVEKEFSFFHTPSLIKTNRIEAIFILIFEALRKRADSPDESFKEKMAAIGGITDGNQRTARLDELAEKMILQLLTVMKDCELVDFKSFTDKENKQFNQEFDRTVRKISGQLAPT
ncbi:MAG: hypothetical protein KGY61_13920 [Desulfobacterales bacterium]|nr:hypothetical protein [Desulfobacterales bacterium]